MSTELRDKIAGIVSAGMYDDTAPSVLADAVLALPEVVVALRLKAAIDAEPMMDTVGKSWSHESRGHNRLLHRLRAVSSVSTPTETPT